MAAIDKMYGTAQQWDLLHDFLKSHGKHDFLRDLYPRPPEDSKVYTISSFGKGADRWLYNNCPLDFVVKRLKEQYKDLKNLK